MIQARNIHSLTDFQRNTATHLRNLRASGLPEVLTVKGRAEVVIQSADAYEALLSRLELHESAAAINRGLAQNKAGLSITTEELEERMKGKFPQLRGVS